MEFQPVVEAPPPAVLTDASLYGRHTLPVGESVLRLVLSKDLPTDVTRFGFAEVCAGFREVHTSLTEPRWWSNFRTRTYYHQGSPYPCLPPP